MRLEVLGFVLVLAVLAKAPTYGYGRVRRLNEEAKGFSCPSKEPCTRCCTDWKKRTS
jgi:hypothetical protein